MTIEKIFNYTIKERVIEMNIKHHTNYCFYVTIEKDCDVVEIEIKCNTIHYLTILYSYKELEIRLCDDKINNLEPFWRELIRDIPEWFDYIKERV